MSRLILVFTGIMCLAGFVMACNNQPQHVSVPPDSSVDSGSIDSTASTAVPVQNEHLHTVEISGMKFNPEELTIPKGDTVIWINNDITNHCVTEVNKAWTSSALVPAQSFKKVITGNTDYYCAIHMVMKGKIIVQ